MLRLLIGVLCVILIAAFALTVVARPTTAIMTVPEVDAALQLHPAAWSGRVVFVRGWSSLSIGQGCAAPRRRGRPASGSPTCAQVWVLLTSTPTFSAAGAFPVLLRPGGFDPDRPDTASVVGGLLRALPAIGPLLAPWGGSHILRVRLTMTPGTCPPRAVLTGALPPFVLRCAGGIEVP